MHRGVSVSALVTGSVLLAPATPISAAWTPPVGIPMPTFGVAGTAPPVPSPWSTPTPGFYYVDATSSAATDSSNPYGMPAKPRRTIPVRLPAGAVVELHGTYDYYHGSPNTIVASGTASSPVFIRGVSPSSRPLIRNNWEVQGTYAVLENLEFGPYDQNQTGTLAILAPSSRLALRDSNVHGTPSSGSGIIIASWIAGASADNVVLLRD